MTKKTLIQQVAVAYSLSLNKYTKRNNHIELIPIELIRLTALIFITWRMLAFTSIIWQELSSGHTTQNFTVITKIIIIITVSVLYGLGVRL